jgi:RecA/RadA recombinase
MGFPGLASDDPSLTPKKKKTTKKKSTKSTSLISKDLIKEFGQQAFIMGDQLESNPIVHVSPRIDLLLGGGIPGGSVVTLVGDPKSGKTVTALHMLGKAQEVGRPIFFINVEGRIKPRDLAGIKCLDESKLHITRSYRDEATGQTRIFKAHEFLKVVEDTVHNVPHAVIVIDSISSLVTEGEMVNELNKKDRAPGATLMAKFCRRLSNTIPVNDIILIGILHFYANTSGFGKHKLVGGGTKLKYAYDVGLECKGFKFMREGGLEEGRPIGQSVDWITTSTAFAPPGQRGTSMITYGIGIDELYEIVEMSIELGFVQQNKAWFRMAYMEDHVSAEEWKDGKPFNVNGKEKLVNRIRENEHERELLIKDFHMMMGIEE